MRIVILGLSVTSSWGNGHATTYRSLIRGLTDRGNTVLFLERDKPWYAENRDLPKPPFGRVALYGSLAELDRLHGDAVRKADLVIVGSYVPEGVAVCEWVLDAARGVTAFYDIDTPVTLAKLARGDEEYLAAALVSRFDLYFSFTGGPLLRTIERELGAHRAVPLYCSVDPRLYYPEPADQKWTLGYLGTYSADRQPSLEALLLEPARELVRRDFAVAGPLYPPNLLWPSNVERIEHLPPALHRGFYNSQAFTLNVTRADMVRAGYSPSVRLFEAAACGTPVISDDWSGLDEIFVVGREILVARNTADVTRMLRSCTEAQRQRIGERARQRVLTEHTGTRRAMEIEQSVGKLNRTVTSARAVSVSKA